MERDYIELKFQSKARPNSNNNTLFHLVDPSYYPVWVSFSLVLVMLTCAKLFHNEIISVWSVIHLVFGLTFLSLFLTFWWSDVADEAGQHTSMVIRGIKMGMFFFIISEVMFFAGFFWSFFYASINPSIEIGSVWPPLYFASILINPLGLPLLNTILLLSSGLAVTCSHGYINLFLKNEVLMKTLFHTFGILKKDLYFFIISLMKLKKFNAQFLIKIFFYFLITILCALTFTFIQLYEYFEALFNISDSIFGCCFYMLTGFHGFHVIVGTVFLLVSFIQFFSHQIQHKSETGIECAIWYWHFVDVVWLFLFVFLYVWSWKWDVIVSTESYNSICEAVIGSPDGAHGGFQASGNQIAERLIALHHDVMAWVTFIFIIVVVVMTYTIYLWLDPNDGLH